MLPRLKLIAVIILLVHVEPSFAQRAVLSPPEGFNWQPYAVAYLTNSKGKPFDPKIDTTFLRCVKMNNYPCLKQRNVPWPHTPGQEGKDGANDGADGPRGGHAIFDHPKWSIIADLQWFERNTNRGTKPRSALELAEIYMPWCDTLGSSPKKADDKGRYWGNGCKVYVRTAKGWVSKSRAPVGFVGPICGKPQNGQVPTPSQRQACNDPPSAALTWTRNTGVSTTQPLVLFDQSGRPTEIMLNIIKNVVLNENGHYQPNERLLDEAKRAFTSEASK